MRDGASDALVQATGKSYPADYTVWNQYLNHPEKGVPPEQGLEVKLASWIGIGR